MIKSELINKIAKQFPNLTHLRVEEAINAILENIINELANGGHVEIRHFGRLSARKRNAIIGRNPRNGEAVLIDARYVVRFKSAKELNTRVNESAGEYPII